MRVGGLFSGIGGWELGLERAGMRVVWHCEQDPYCQRVLERHWPGVPCYPDVRELRAADAEPVDVLCGGFPCQDLSTAGRRAGIEGARSGLWGEYARLVGELRPRYVLVENVANLLVRGLDRVVGDLAALGYDAEWDCLPASAFGAPHRRDRIWLVAYSGGVGNAHSAPEDPYAAPGTSWPAARQRGGGARASNEGRSLDDAGRRRHGVSQGEVRPGRLGVVDAGWWASEPDVGRVADGVPEQVDRLHALGNSLLPQIAEWIGRRVLEWERARVQL